MTELIPEYDSSKSFYRKAMVCDGKNGWYLYSYDTEVFFIPFDDCDDNEEDEMRLLWRGYSATTYGHIREFIKHYATEWQKRNLSDRMIKSEIESLYKGEK